MTKQTPWIERSFSFAFDTGYFPVVFSRLEGAIFRLYSLLSNAEEEVCEQRTQGWSVKEHLGHLLDMEDLWWQRLNDYLEGRAILAPGDLLNRKTEEAGHNQKSLEKLLENFTLQRQRLLEAVYPFTSAELQLTATHPRLNIPMRLIDSLHFVGEHDDHHISAISNLLRRPAEDV